MTLGALAATQNQRARRGAGVPLPDVVRLAYDGDAHCGLPSLDDYEADVAARRSDAPAAFIVETVQGEGGLHVASVAWLRQLAGLARRLGALLIVDDIQAGCGRTGPFFSFERAGLNPDIVCLAKSIGGLGLPMALVLIKPHHDAWAPGEHNGTFRGNNLAFACASAALGLWEDAAFTAAKQASEAAVGLGSTEPAPSTARTSRPAASASSPAFASADRDWRRLWRATCSGAAYSSRRPARRTRC